MRERTKPLSVLSYPVSFSQSESDEFPDQWIVVMNLSVIVSGTGKRQVEKRAAQIANVADYLYTSSDTSALPL